VVVVSDRVMAYDGDEDGTAVDVVMAFLFSADAEKCRSLQGTRRADDIIVLSCT